MRRVLLVMMVTISSIVPAGRAAMAEPGGASITVVGKRTGYVDVRFDEKFQLEDWNSEIDFKGQFAGWLIHPLGQTSELDYDRGDFEGAYMIRKVRPTKPEYDPNLSIVYLPNRTFAPGLYRVYLLADGPAKIRIPMTKGTHSKTIRPTHPTPARWTAEEIPLTAPGVVNDSVSQPLRVTSDSLTLSSIYLYSNAGVTVQNVAACLRDRPEEAPPPEQNCEGGGAIGPVIHAQQDYALEFTYVYPPGAVAPRNYYTFANARAATVDRVMGSGVTIQLQGV